MFKHVILQNGHCDYIADDSKYETTLIAYTGNTLNKILQVILFTAYYIYVLLQNNSTSCLSLFKMHQQALISIDIGTSLRKRDD